MKKELEPGSSGKGGTGQGPKISKPLKNVIFYNHKFCEQNKMGWCGRMTEAPQTNPLWP